MANTKRRTNISIDSKLWKRATAYGKEHGRSLSSMLEEGLKYVIDGAPVKAEHTNLAPSPQDITAQAEAYIRTICPEILAEYLRSPPGIALVQRVASENAPPAPATSTPKASQHVPIVFPPKTVEVSPEVRERLRKFTALQLVGATGMDRTVLSKIRSGNRSRIEKGTFEKVMAGLEQLESQS
jgi:hypothetical protein